MPNNVKIKNSCSLRGNESNQLDWSAFVNKGLMSIFASVLPVAAQLMLLERKTSNEKWKNHVCNKNILLELTKASAKSVFASEEDTCVSGSFRRSWRRCEDVHLEGLLGDHRDSPLEQRHAVNKRTADNWVSPI